MKMSSKWLVRYCTWLEKWHLAIILFSAVAASVGLVYSAKLYKNLRTDLEEVLPDTAQSVIDLKKVEGRVGGLNHLSIVVQSQDVQAGRRFAADMTARLRKLPATMVERVQDGIQEERAFFERNKALYMELSDWEDLSRYVRERIRHERRAKNPFSLGLTPTQSSPSFDFDSLKKKYEDRSKDYNRFPEGRFESRDGHEHVILAFLPGKVTDIDSNQRLSDLTHQIVVELNPKSYSSDLIVGFDGDVQNVVEEHRGVVEDLVKSFIVVTLLVGVALLVFFRSFVGVYSLCASLFAGVAITFGISYFVVGYLNANTAFLGSIVVGNGINFGIIMLARYLEERRLGLDWRAALPRSLGLTMHATWTAAAAAGFAYASLMLTGFRGFNQFGIIGGLGMFICWVTSFTTLPAFLIWFDRRGWIKPRVREHQAVFAKAVARFVVRAHKPIVAMTLVSVFVAGIYVSHLSADTLESDFSKLRNKESMLHGAGFWGKKVDAVFERYLTPTLVLTQNVADTGKVLVELEKVKALEGANSPISEIHRVEDFVPKDQPRKIRLITGIQERVLNPKALAKLSAQDRKMVDDFIPKDALRVITAEDLPGGVTHHFREQDGTMGHMVHVYPKLPGAQGGRSNFWDGKEVIHFAQRIREAVRNAGVEAVIAGQPPLSADMITSVATEGPKATAAAFLAVIVLVLIVFPSWQIARSILGALLLGVLWLGGLIGAFDLKINFLNFIALPITFGIGVDYAVNILSRYRMDGSRSIELVIAQTGGAVALCSATTIIGYSSLLMAGNQAFVSFGLLAVLGELTCIIAAVIALPAVWYFFDERKETAQDEASKTHQEQARV